MRQWYQLNPKNIRTDAGSDTLKLNCLGFAYELVSSDDKFTEAWTTITTSVVIANKIGLKISTKNQIYDYQTTLHQLSPHKVHIWWRNYNLHQ